MDVSRITGEEAGTLTEVLAESPNKGLGPAALTMHSLHWAGHAGKGVRRAVRHPPPASLSSHSLLGYATHWTTHPFCTLFLLLNGIPRYPINASPFHHLLPLIISRLHLSSLPQWSSRPLHVDVSVHKHLEKANKQLMAVIDFHYYKGSHSL